jgi:DNA primase
MNIDYFLKELKLEGLSKKNNRLYNSKCPICGDSKQSKKKKRLYIINNGGWFCFCHNCSYSSTLRWFIHTLDLNLFKKYLLEELKSDPNLISDYQICSKKESFIDPIEFQFFRFDSPHLQKKLYRYAIEEMEDLLIQRKIINKMYGFQARSVIYKSKIKYLSHFEHDGKPKIFNYYNIDKSKTIFVVEGIIDSLGLENSIAMLGSRLILAHSDLEHHKDKLLFVFDNDQTGKERSIQYLQKGYSIAKWPNEFRKYKDVNEIKQEINISKKELSNEFCKEIYSGLKGLIEFKLKERR